MSKNSSPCVFIAATKSTDTPDAALLWKLRVPRGAFVTHERFFELGVKYDGYSADLAQLTLSSVAFITVADMCNCNLDTNCEVVRTTNSDSVDIATRSQLTVWHALKMHDLLPPKYV